jgi:enterochelin esterase-like enzyme
VSPAEVVGSTLVFSVDDEGRELRRVLLECDDAVWGPRRFRHTARGWRLSLALPDLQRLEYRLLVTRSDGQTALVLDPDNPEAVATAFGERSVAILPGYVPPRWLSQPETLVGGTTRSQVVSTRQVGDLPVQVWSPAGIDDYVNLPLLVVHDGPEMVKLAGLDRYAAAMIESGTLPPFRMMLCQPVRRDDWYAANPRYLAAELRVLEEVADSYGVVREQVVVMGASLGGLTALLLGVESELPFAGVLSQSGSFFTPELDPQEGSYPWFDRITTAVDLLDPSAMHPMPIALTWGAMEENAANNRDMEQRLRKAGHDVRYLEVRDLHNYSAWRDAWDPILTELLRDCWPHVGGRVAPRSPV